MRVTPVRNFIVKGESILNGEPEAVEKVLQHYKKRIRCATLENGHVNKDTEDSIESRLVAALFKFRFGEQEV